MTHQISPDLDGYRIRLVCGEGVPFRFEPKLAAMVVMKIFLGTGVSESLQMNMSESTEKLIGDVGSSSSEMVEEAN
ncbi:hypothetical protein ANO14919_027640 [Xylariales sp. No.14919]|nr:hypothetical protein ANO14919_027640 [Xylariales sp. No.14919]